MSLIVKAGKAGKNFLKAKHILPEEAPYISYTRRIERVMTDRRICAMTFDDGPMDLPAAPDQFHGRALTDLILDALAEFDAKGTFDVIGDTSLNYPDKAGKPGSAAWGGIRYDHYPDFEQDKYGGVVHNDRLIRRMLEEGHQITNHGYRHILFGKKSFVYGQRVHYGSVHSAVGDLRRLDQLMKDRYNYDITMGRPPHYVDSLNGGFTSYDVYDRMGYQYLAASFDGAGWLPSTKRGRDALEEEITLMTNPVRAALLQNPDAFCGQIIFQKDGYNMSRRTPVAWGLPLQLEILHQYGYQVVTVAELMDECPFADISRDTPLFEKMARLAKRRGVAFSDNKLRLEDRMTMGELAMLLAPKEESLDLRWARMRRVKQRVHPYYGALAWCTRERILPRNVKPEAPVTELPVGIFDETKTFTRRAIYEAFREDWIDQGEHQEAEIKRIEEQLHGWVVPPLPPAPPLPPVPGTPDEQSIEDAERAAAQAQAEAVEETEIADGAETPQAVTNTETESIEDAETEEAAETVEDADGVETPEAMEEAETEELAETVTEADETAETVTEAETVEEAETIAESVEEEEAIAEAETDEAEAVTEPETVEAESADDAAPIVAEFEPAPPPVIEPPQTAAPVAPATLALIESLQRQAAQPVQPPQVAQPAQPQAVQPAPPVMQAPPQSVQPPQAAQPIAQPQAVQPAPPVMQAPPQPVQPPQVAQPVAQPVQVPQPAPVAPPQPPHVETAEEVYVHALAEVRTEDAGNVHKIVNLPHLEDIPHVDGIPVLPPPPQDLKDLFPDME